MTVYVDAEHHTQIARAVWPWASFPPAEIACRGTGKVHISRDAMHALQALRDKLGAPMIVNSAYRSPEHNRAVGGAKNSQHVQGIAFDVSMANHDPEEFVAAAKAVGFQGIGWYGPKAGNFIHIDMGPARTWGKPWKAPRFDKEARPGTAKKAVGVLGLAGMGASALEAVKPESLVEIQQTVQPWVATAPVFQAVFAALGFAVVGLMIYRRFFRSAP